MRPDLFVLTFAVLHARPIHAEPWIDYDLLMERNAARVVTGTNPDGRTVRTLDLGDGVTVSCDGQGCIGMDRNGAVGCAMMIVADFQAIAQRCPEMGIAEERANLSRLYERLGGYVAANAVPVLDWPTLKARIEAGSGYPPTLPREECLALEDEYWVPFGAGLATPDAIDRLDESLATPRLPVSNPCL